MKRVLLAVLATMGSMTVVRGALVWDAREARVEAKSNEREVTANYRFKNAGSAPVTVLDIVASCDCTTVELPKRVYAPGEGGTLTARLALGNQAGLLEETFAVITDAAPGEPVVLRLQADIQSLIEMSPVAHAWRSGGEAEESFTMIAAATPLPIESVAITGIFPGGAATARIETVAEGRHYRLAVRPLAAGRTLNFSVAGVATFADGTTQDFAVYGRMTK